MLLTIASTTFIMVFLVVAALGHVLVIQAIWRGWQDERKPDGTRPTQPLVLRKCPQALEGEQQRAA